MDTSHAGTEVFRRIHMRGIVFSAECCRVFSRHMLGLWSGAFYVKGHVDRVVPRSVRVLIPSPYGGLNGRDQGSICCTFSCFPSPTAPLFYVLLLGFFTLG